MSKKTVLCVLVLMLAPCVMAQTSAMLFATGKVNVNGIGVTRSTSVMDGDVIETAADGTVTLAGTGTSVLVQSNSMVLFNKQGVSLANGSMSVKTTDGMALHIGTIQVQPMNGAARYRVTQSGGNVTMDVLEGGVTVTEGGKSVNVAPGRSITMPCANCNAMVSQAMQARETNRKKILGQQEAAMNQPLASPAPANTIAPGTASSTSAGAAGSGGGAGSAGAGGGFGGSLTPTQTGFVIGGIAAASGGIAAAIALNKKSASAVGP